MKIVGLDPGIRNIGWAEYSNGTWFVRALYMPGSYVKRQRDFKEWCEERMPGTTGACVEKLQGGANHLQQELAANIALVAAHLPPSAQMTWCVPSTHFHFVSKIGKYNELYREELERLVGSELNRHELTAVACVLLMLAYKKGRLSEFYLKRLQWLTQK